MANHSVRIRWAAIGAAIAVMLGAGSVGVVNAVKSSGERPVYTAIPACRVTDTRPNLQVGPKNTPLGQGSTMSVKVTGNNGRCSAIPTDITSVSLNVTTLQATQNTHITIWPDGPVPNASSLNPAPGTAPAPNAVTTKVAADGTFKVFNFRVSVNVVIDIVGYHQNHNHDDRYYTEAEADARYVNLGEVRIRQGVSALQPYYTGPSAVEYLGGGARVTSNGSSIISFDGPMWTDGRFYRLKAMTYCITTSGSRYINRIRIWMDGGNDDVDDGTDRTTSGCYTVDMDGTYSDGYAAHFHVSGATGAILFESITTTWELAPPNFVPSILPLDATLAEAPSLEAQSAGG